MEELYDEHIQVVSLQFFLENLLPSLPTAFDIEKVKTQLGTDSVMDKKGWRAFKKTRPKLKKSDESTAFRPLQTVFDGITASILRLHSEYKRALTMKHNRNRAPLSRRGDSDKSRPDSILELLLRLSVLVDKGDNSDWGDIPVSIEFRKGNGEKDRQDNRAKILWSLHHMMRNDPCRRFAFGITIENTTTRIWFCCRTAVLVSKEFDLFDERDTVIRTFASFAFASNEDLGYDPTITRVLVDNQPQYDIQVTDKVYRTIHVLSNFGADAIIGRGTRVFEVYDKEDVNKTSRVLKDVWVEEDRSREGDILEKLFEKIQSSGGDNLCDARRYFLTTVCYGDVEIDGHLDNTRNIMHHGGLPLTDGNRNLTQPKPIHRSEDTLGSNIGSVPVFDDPLTRTVRQRRATPVRVHHRTVSEEVCVAIHNLTSLRDVYQSLNDGMKALQIMHEHHYVHRDISTGNILFYKGQGKLSDLEYAKEMGTGDGHDVRTGTAYFMAVEVALRRYVFQRDRLPGQVRQGLTFRYNPLHDIESMWWITNYFLFRHFTEANHDGRDLDKDAHTLFPSTSDSLERGEALKNPEMYTDLLVHLPGSFQTHGAKMDDCRLLLCQRYRQAESGSSIDELAFDRAIHDAFTDMFTELHGYPASAQAVVATSQSKSPEVEKKTEPEALLPMKRKIRDFDQEEIQEILKPNPLDGVRG